MVFTMFIITDTIQVRTITNFIIPLQSGGALSKRQADRQAFTSTEFYAHLWDFSKKYFKFKFLDQS